MTLLKVYRIYLFALIFVLIGFQSYGQNCSVNAGLDQDVCANQEVILQGGAAGKIDGVPMWTLSSGPSVVIENPNQETTKVLGASPGETYVFTFSALCEDGNQVSQSVTVVIQPITNAVVDDFNNTCPGTYSLNANAPGTNETGMWSFPNGNNGLTIGDVNSPSTTITLPEGSESSTIVQWTITNNNGCSSADDHVVVYNEGTNSTVEAGTNKVLDNCYTVTTSTTLNGSFAGNQNGIWTLVSTTASTNPVIADEHDPNTTVSNLSEGTYTFRWFVISSCLPGTGGFDEVSVQVPEGTQDVTNANVAVKNHFFCTPVTQLTLEGTAPQFTGERVLWSQISGPAGVVFNPEDEPVTLVTGLDGSSTYKFRYQIINDGTGCVSTAGDVTVRYFLDTPTIDVTSPLVEGICGDLSVTIPFTYTGGNKTKWRIDSGPYTTNFKNIGGNELTVEFKETGVYELLFVRGTETNGEVVDCNLAFDNVTVVVANEPTQSNAGTNQNLACGITETELVANTPDEGGGTWTQVSGPSNATFENPIDSKSKVSGLQTGVYTFRWLISTELICTDTQGDITVTVSDPNIIVDAGTDENICANSEIALDGNSPKAGETGLWTVVPQTDSLLITDASDPRTKVTGFDQNTTYQFTWTISNECGSEQDFTIIRVDDREGPTPAEAGPDQCLEETGGSDITSFQMDGNTISKGRGEWIQVEGPSTLTFSDKHDPNAIATNAQNGQYEIVWESSEFLFRCQISTDTVNVSIYEELFSDAGVDFAVCSDQFTMAAGALPDGAIGQWVQISGNAGWTVDDINSPTATFSNVLPGQYVFDWDVSGGTGCGTATDEVKVLVGQPVTMPDAGPDQIQSAGGALCGQTTYEMQANTPTAGVGVWSLVSGPNFPNFTDATDPNMRLSNLVTGTYVFRWTISSGTVCPPETDDVALQVVSPVDAGNDEELCDVTEYTLQANEGAIGTWTKTAGPGADPVKTSDNTAIASLVPGNTYTFRFTSDALFGCASVFDEVDIIVKGKFTDQPDAGADQEHCTDTPGLQILMSGNSPTSAFVDGTWSIIEGPSGHSASFSDVNDPNAEFENFIAGVYVVEWTFDLNIDTPLSCSVPLSDVVKISVYDPGLADAGPDKTECLFNDFFLLEGVQPAAGIGTWTAVSYNGGAVPAGVTIASPNLNTSQVRGITDDGTYVFKWTVTSGAGVCAPSEDEVSIFFPPATTAPDAGPDQSLCPTRGVTTTTVLDGNVVENGEWRFVSGPTTPTIVDATNPRTSLQDLEIGTYVMAWYSLSDNVTCDRFDEVSIIVNPVLSLANAGPDLTFPDSQNIILQATTPSTGTGEWTQVSGPINLTFIDANDPNSGVVGAVTGVYELQWTISGGNVCGNSTDRMILTIVGTADLSLTKTVNEPNPNVGDDVTFTIRIKNDGPDDATGVAIGDVVPFGYQIQSVSGTAIIENNNISWRNLSLASGETQSFTLVCTVRDYDGLNVYKNQAGVVASDQFDPDSSPANDDGDQSEDDEDAASVSPKVADLSLDVSVSKALPKVGEVITVFVEVTNDGPDDASGVGFGVVVPQGLQIGAVNDGGFLQSPKVVGWTNENIQVSETKKVSFEATVSEPTGLSIEYTLFAEVSASDQYDPDSTPNNDLGIQSEDDEDALTLGPQSADLEVVYTSDLDPALKPNVGDVIGLRIQLINNGPNEASNFSVETTLFERFTYVNGSASNGGAIQNGVLTWDNLNLVGRDDMEVTFSVIVDSPLFPGQSFKNTAQIVSSDQYDPDSSPNNDTGSQIEDDEDNIVFTPQVADLSLRKTVADYTAELQQNVFFTVFITNDGPDNATNVIVKDQLPAGLEYVQDDSGGDYDPSNGEWVISELAVGETKQLDIEAKIVQFGRLTNVAELIAVDQFDPDSTPDNDDLIEDDQDNASVTQEVVVDLSLTKTVDELAPNVGDQVTFSLNLTNDGPGDATGVSVLDLLATGFTYQSHSGDGTYNRINGDWLIGDVNVGDTKTLNIVATVNPTGSYTNSAQVLAQDQIDIDSDPGNNVETEDDQEIVELTPIPSIDLELTKTVNNATPNACSIIQFTVEVTNLGPSEASGIEVTDLLPAGYTFVSYSSSTGAYNQFTGLWVLDNAIIAGESEFLLINALVNATGERENIAEITGIDQTDSDLNNNIDQVTTTPIDQIDLALDLSVNSLVPFVNEIVEFTVVVQNDGCSTATNVEASQLVVSGFDYVSSTSTNGTYDETTGVWSIPQLASSDSDTLIISSRVASFGDYQASAQITAADQADADSNPNNGVKSEDDQDEVFIFPRSLIDLSLTTSASTATPFVGEQVTFTTELTAGAGEYSNATNIAVLSELPDGYSLLNASFNSGAYNSTTGVWNVTSLPPDSTVTLALTAVVLDQGDYNFVTEVEQVNEQDIDSTPGNGDDTEDDYASVEVTPIELSDLELSSSATDLSPPVNSEVTIEIVLENKGPNTATNILLSEVIPAGLVYQRYTATKGVYGNSTNSWSISSLSVGEVARLLLIFEVAENATADAYLYTMEVQSADQEDSDSAHGNGQTTEDDYTSLTLTPINQADLSLSKIVDNVQHTVGDFVEFTLTIENDGPATATNIVVEDQLPTGYTFVSASGDGTFADSLWTINSLASQASVDLVIRARVKASGDYLNYAEVIAVDQIDPDSAPDNGALDEDDLDFAETGASGLISISLTKSVDELNPEIGDNVTYTVTVTNNGPSNATEVVVADRLPTGLNYQSATVDGTYDEVTGSWVIGDVPNGTSKTLQIVAQVLGTGEYANIAEVVAHAELDNNSSPNNNDSSEDDQAAVTIVPTRTADLQLIKTVDKDTVDVGGIARFDIQVTNLGPSDASDINVFDLLPNGYLILTTSSTTGVFNQETGVWSLTENLAPGASENLVVTTLVIEGTDYENIAIITSSSQLDNNPDNDDDSASLVAVPVADLSLAMITDDNRPSVQEETEIQLIIKNDGPSTATNVVTKVALPSGLSFVAADPSGAYDENTALWTVSSLAENMSDTLTLRLNVAASGAYEIYAEIESTTEKDDDSTPSNDSTDEDDDASITLFPIALVDVSLSAAANSLTPTIGDTVTITGEIANDGPSDATNIIVGVNNSDGIQFISNDVSGGVYDELRHTWTITSLPATSTLDFTYEAVILEDGSHNIVYEVLNQTEIDFDSEPRNNEPTEDDQVNIIFEPIEALDLVITKTVGATNVDVGQLIEFSIEVRNDGPSTASEVIVSDVLASGFQFLSYSATAGVFDQTSGEWNLQQALNAGESEILKVIARVISSADANAYVNNATITNYLPANSDIDNSNNTASVTISPTPIIELALEKIVDVRFPEVGSNIVYTLSLENQGFSQATGVEVTDLLKDGFTFVSAQPAADYNETSGLWTVGTLDVGQTKELQITVTVNAAGDYLNEAEVTAANEVDASSTPNNGDEDELDYASVLVSPRPLVDIEVTQAVDNINQAVGATVNLTITTTNNGPSDASGIVVSDLLPDGLTFLSSTASLGDYNPSSGDWVVGAIASGQSESLQISALVLASGSYTNLAELVGLDQRDSDSSPANGNSQEDDQAALEIVPQQNLDLVLTKFASNNNPRVGGLVEFSIIVANNGPSTATNIQVTDILSSAFEYLSFNATSGRYDPASGIWRINASLATGESESITLITRVLESNEHINQASITDYGPVGSDSDLANNTAEVSINPVDQIDLELGMITSNFVPNAGDNIDLSLTIGNKGSSTATNVVVSVPIQSGFNFVLASPSNEFNSANGEWTVGSLGIDEQKQLNLRLQVLSNGEFEMIAEVSRADQEDVDSSPNNGDNLEDDYVSVTIYEQDLVDVSMAMTVSNNTPTVGTEITYEITAANAGPSTATGLIITSTFDDGLNYLASTMTEGSFNENTGAWNLGLIDAGNTETLTITFSVQSEGDYKHIVEVTSANQTDVDSKPDNNNSSEDDFTEIDVVPAQSADLSIEKVVSNSTPGIQQLVEFIVKVTNEGPSNIDYIEVTDVLPLGFELVGVTTTQGDYNPATGIWSLNRTLRSGQSDNLVMVARVLESSQANAYTNRAEITSYNPDGIDADLTNNSSEITLSPVSSIDLSLLASVDNASPDVDEEVLYTLTLFNGGPSTATNIVVDALLPDGLTFVSASPTNDYDANSGEWSISQLAVDGVTQLFVKATVNATGNYQKTFEVASANEPDLDSTPNNGADLEDDIATISLSPTDVVDIEIEVSLSNNSPTVSDRVQAIVTVTNNGPSTANSLSIRNFIGTGFSFAGATASEGDINGQATIWTLDQLSLGQQQSLTIELDVLNEGNYIIVSELISVTEDDIDSTPNNGDTDEDDLDFVQVISIAGVLDLSVTKTVSNDQPLIGDLVEFDVFVENAGPSEATGVVVNDLLGDGYEFIGYAATNGLYNERTGNWTLNTSLTSGQQEILKIIARVEESNAPTAYNNTASLSSYLPINTDADASNNTATVTVTPQVFVDLEVLKRVNEIAPDAGDLVDFTLAIINRGPSTATGVVVQDNLPSGLSFVDAVDAASYDNASGQWTVGDLSAGEIKSLVITAQVLPAGDYTNTMEVIAVNETDVDSSPNNGLTNEDDYSSVTLYEVDVVDLALTVTANDFNPLVGNNVTYSIEITNDGPSDATGVTVKLNNAIGLAFESANATQGVYDETTKIWNIGRVNVNEKVSLSVTMLTRDVGPYTFIAQVETQNEKDVDSAPGNNSIFEDDGDLLTVEPVRTLDLQLTKVVSDINPVIGDLIEFDIKLTNLGPSVANFIVVSEILPDGFSYVTSTATAGSFDAASGLWSVQSFMLAGQIEELKIFAKVVEVGNANDYVNTAVISSYFPLNADIDLTNNEASVSVIPQSLIDLELSAEIDNMEPTVETEIEYLLTLINQGPSLATNIEVTYEIPDGYDYVSSSDDYNPSTSIWTIPFLAPNESAQQPVSLFVRTIGAYNNQAEVTKADQEDIDSTPNNGSEDDFTTLSPNVKELVDLVLTSSVSNVRPSTNEVITITFTLENRGPSKATNVVVGGLLNSGFTFINADPDQGVFNQAAGAWAVGSVEVGLESAIQLRLQVRVNPAGNFTLVAEVTSVDQPAVSTPNNSDPNELDFTQVNNITPETLIDLSLSSLAEAVNPLIGDKLLTKFTITNSSFNEATGVKVRLDVPDGLRFLGATGSVDIDNSEWVVSSVAANSSEDLVVEFEILDLGTSYTTIAEVSTADQDDIDSQPNNADPDEDDYTVVDLDPESSIDLQLEILGDRRPAIGEEIEVDIVINNSGVSVARNIVAELLIGEGYDVVEATDFVGNYDQATNTWSINALPPDGIALLQLKLLVKSIDDYIVCGEIKEADGLDVDSTPGNNLILEDDFDCFETFPIVSIDIPEGFSPNGDGINDVFEVRNLEVSYPNFRYEIFNRWGERVYQYAHNGDPNKEPDWWDGTSTSGRTVNKDKMSPSATYYYVIHYNDADREPTTGWVYVNY